MLRLRSELVGLLLASTTLACSSGTEPVKRPTAGAMDIIGGNGQTDTVTKLLPDPIEVLVTTDPSSASGIRITASVGSIGGASFTSHDLGTPVPGQLVNFVVIDPDCGRPFAGAATTNVQGIAVERWELGEVAKVCSMEARAVNQVTGEPIVFSTATATALPGVVVDNSDGGANLQLKSGLDLDLHVKVAVLFDEFGNKVDPATVTPAWRLDTEPFGATPGAPTASGWTVAAQADGTYYLALSIGEWRGQYEVRWSPSCTGGSQCVGF